MSGIADIARPDILALEPYASARSLAAAAAVSLDANENPWPGAGDGGLGLNRYPDPQPGDLVAAFAGQYRTTPDRVLVTRGSDEAIDLLVRAFCPAGDSSVAQCPPCFGMYAIAARIQGARVVEAPLEPETFDLPVDQLTALDEPGLRLVFLCSPNNPTGNAVPLAAVREVCEAHAGRALVVVDEAYGEFGGATAIELLDEVPNLAVLRTLSKAWGLAGARCGVLVARPDVVELLRRILPPYPLPTPTVAAARKALAPEGRRLMAEQVERLNALREGVVDGLSDEPAVDRVWPSVANFVLVRMPRASEFHRFAAERGVLLRDFSARPGLRDCLRVTIGTETENQRLFGVLEDWRSAS